jgi:four helix bundle protein
MSSNNKDLVVWQKSMDLVTKIYELTADFPSSEIYGLTSQSRRSAVSIPSNIAEGSQKKTRKDFANFLRIAKGSSAELETQLLIAQNLKFVLKPELFRECLNLVIEIQKMLSSLESKLLHPAF